MHEIKEEQRGYAPVERVPEADAPLNVEFFVGVVPPSRMEELFHKHARDKFDYIANHHARNKDEQGSYQYAVTEQRNSEIEILDRRQGYCHCECARAVYRAHRTFKEASVDPFARAYRAVDRFAEPADCTVKEEIQHIYYYCHKNFHKVSLCFIVRFNSSR